MAETGESFLYREARLLEQNRLEEWLALFTDDARYWMPVREQIESRKAAPDASDGFALFDDDKKSLTLRVARIMTGAAHAEAPVSVTQRLITNVLVGPKGDELEVSSNFMVYQERRGRHGVTFFGRREDVLRREAASFRIARRKIELAQTILPATLSIFL